MGSNVINVYHQPLSEVPQSIYHQLVRLNMRDLGQMYPEITRQHRFPSEFKDTRVFYVKGRDNVIKGWSLVYRKYSTNIKYSTIKYSENMCHFYVRKKERNKGYGSALAQAVKEVYKRKVLVGYSDRSTIFPRHKIKSPW